MATIYEIRVQDHLSNHWAEWFDPLVIENKANGETTLHGPVRDQAELFGLLLKVYNLNLTLLAVHRLDAER